MGHTAVVSTIVTRRKTKVNVHDKLGPFSHPLKCKGGVEKKAYERALTPHHCHDPAGWTPLHWAAAINDVGSVIALIDARKPTLNVQNKKGETPLHLAARENNVDVIRYADGGLWAGGTNLDLFCLVRRKRVTLSISMMLISMSS